MTVESKLSVKEMVAGGKRVRFVRARCGELIYATESGFEFRVPIYDMGDGVFLNEDRAVLFMRWIRREIDEIERG
jgi:hypothetical protein